MTDLNIYLNKDLNADDVAHSNGYGQAAGGGGAGGLSMEQRRKLLNQPRVIGAYQSSKLGRAGSTSKARTFNQLSRKFDPSTGEFSDDKLSNRQKGGIKDTSQVDSSSIEKRRRFIEPTSRKYDKFG